MLGSATFTTLASSTTMNWATATTASTALALTRTGRATALGVMLMSVMAPDDRSDPGELSSPDGGDWPAGRGPAPEQRPTRTRDTHTDDDGEAEHGVRCARPSSECDARADHGDREPDEERDEQLRRHRQAILGRRCG